MHVVEASAIETTQHVHDVIESYCSVKCSRVWLMVALCLNYIPCTSVIIIGECIIKPLLLNIDSAKYYHFVFYWDSWMTISRLRSYSFDSFDFIPGVWGYILIHNRKDITETVMIEIVHGVFSIPAPKYYHLMVNDYCTVTKSIKRLRFALGF